MQRFYSGKYFDIWIATILTDLKMHDNSQVIAFLNVDVLPRCSIHPLVIACPGDPCILCCCLFAIIILSRRALCGPSQLIRASRDIRAREAPELQSGDKGGTGGHLIAGSKNRDAGPGAHGE